MNEIMDWIRPVGTEISRVLQGNSLEMKIFIFIFGLCVGSFLNVCIVRWPKEESVAKGRSRCPACGVTLPWYENIPVLSFVFLLGKCRHCKKRISWRYPLVELLTGVMFFLLWSRFGLTAPFVFYAYFLAALTIATFVDFEHQIIPDEVSVVGMLVGLTASYFFPSVHGEWDRRLGLAESAMGMIAGIWLVWITAVLGKWAFKKDAMGGGDLKLLGMIGAFIGLKKTLFAFLIAPWIAIPFALSVMLSKKKPSEALSQAGTEASPEKAPAGMIAFGPYLALGAVVSLLWSKKIIAWYAGLLGF